MTNLVQNLEQCWYISPPWGPAPRRTMTFLPDSDGRNSLQYISSPQRAICPNPIILAVIRSLVIGDRQHP